GEFRSARPGGSARIGSTRGGNDASSEGKTRIFRGKTSKTPIARYTVDCILRPVVQRFSLRARTCSPSQEKSMAAKKGAKKGAKKSAKKSSAKKGAAKKGGAKK